MVGVGTQGMDSGLLDRFDDLNYAALKASVAASCPKSSLHVTGRGMLPRQLNS